MYELRFMCGLWLRIILLKLLPVHAHGQYSSQQRGRPVGREVESGGTILFLFLDGFFKVPTNAHCRLQQIFCIFFSLFRNKINRELLSSSRRPPPPPTSLSIFDTQTRTQIIMFKRNVILIHCNGINICFFCVNLGTFWHRRQ